MSKLHATFLRVLALSAAFTLAVAVLGLGATAVPAAPAEPTISVAELQSLLDRSPSGTVQGYFKTVLKGTTVTRIPVSVESVVPNYIPEGALIMFAAAGPDIEQIGGIAQGMSGSPSVRLGRRRRQARRRRVLRRLLHHRLPGPRHAGGVHGPHGRHLHAGRRLDHAPPRGHRGRPHRGPAVRRSVAGRRARRAPCGRHLRRWRRWPRCPSPGFLRGARSTRTSSGASRRTA